MNHGRTTESIFHYTDSHGLLGIVSSHALWASSAAGLNDRAEVTQGWAAIREVLDELPSSPGTEFLREIDPAHAQHRVFVLSGSTRGDDASQWDRYGSNGYGYSLELGVTRRLEAVGRVGTTASRLVSIGDFNEITPWTDAIYSDGPVRETVERLGLQLDQEPLDMVDDDYDYVAGLEMAAQRDLATLAHQVKSPGFSGEHERRVVATFDAGSKHIRYRASAAGIVSYLPLGVRPEGWRPAQVLPAEQAAPLPLRSVTLGPKHAREHVGLIEDLLRAHGYVDVTVQLSSVPLR